MTVGWRPERSAQSSRWLSREFAELFADRDCCHDQPEGREAAFDVLVIGSGYGGAIAAAELAGCRDVSGRPIRLAVLERGREYLPGSFPAGLADLPTRIRGRLAGRTRGGEGLFDLRVGADVSVVLANGLGGGSLINAGVLEPAEARVLDSRWPQALRGGAELAPWYRRARRLLGAELEDGTPNRIGLHVEHRERLPPKAEVLKRMAPDRFRTAAISVAMTNGLSSGGVELSPCLRCGDCATGCNYGAKISLDTNLLATAVRHGAELYCGATVLRVQRPAGRSDLWAVQVVHSDGELRKRETGPRWILTRKLILAAGTLGSTEILQRSQQDYAGPRLSAQLGKRFSGNGDMIAFGYGFGPNGRANAVADEDQPPTARGIGPTITGMLHTVATDKITGQHWPIVIEEMAVPGALRRVVEEAITCANTLHRLQELDCSPHLDGHPLDDPYAVDRQRIRDMSIFAAMGDDGAAGSLYLPPSDGGVKGGDQADGRIEVVWPELRHQRLFDAQMDRLQDLADGAGFSGRTLPNPGWRFVPAAMEPLIGNTRGPAVTVHPLGGCAMADTAEVGVVDEFGRVFDPDGGWHDGLYVLDGAIVPSALAINPALTISALTLRALERLRQDWGWSPAPETEMPVWRRPVVADTASEIEAAAARPRERTRLGVTERLAGLAVLRDRHGQPQRCRVELTLTYQPIAAEDLFVPDASGRLSHARLLIGDAEPSRGQLRIVLEDEWQQLLRRGLRSDELEREAARLACSYPLSGSLTILERNPSRFSGRVLRAGKAWLLNRGLRDTAQSLIQGVRTFGLSEFRNGNGPINKAKRKIRNMVSLANHAGEVRTFRYDLRIGSAADDASRGASRYLAPDSLCGARIRGRKCITYGRPSNPWRQLQELELQQLGDVLEARMPATLVLDPQYLVEHTQPLLRIESQRDHVEALADLMSLNLYFARMLATIHLWNARKPDDPNPTPPSRLPAALRGLRFELHEPVITGEPSRPQRIRLARYRQRGRAAQARQPVLLVHGYSASGTTFAHPALEPGLARDLAEAGRDVWVVDLRSSAGMPDARKSWTFEQIALADIPAAIDFIVGATKSPSVDVVAHCMGAVMVSMAILSADKPYTEIAELLRDRDQPQQAPDLRWLGALRAVPERIRRLVLSQNGPVMVMSPQNIFRGYVMSYVEALFGHQRYSFRKQDGEGISMQLLDRLLATMPYPDHELKRENTPNLCRSERFVGTRHRMDALYGHTFSLDNISDAVLGNIDDFFGPLSLDTVGQVIHFAAEEVATTRDGRNRFVSREALQKLWRFPTLCVHGERNGLADIATLDRAGRTLGDAGCHVELVRLTGQGHQDSLIGTRSHETFAHIRKFLERESCGPGSRPRDAAAAVRAPWSGPTLVHGPGGALRIALGASPRWGRPLAVCLVPIERSADVHGSMARYRTALSARGLTLADVCFPVDGSGDWSSLDLPGWAAGEESPLLWVSVAYGTRTQDIEAALDTAAGLPNAPSQACLVDLPALPRAGEPVRLALGSCQYPPGIFNEMPGYAAWRRMAERCSRGEGPPLIILTGDQVYVDATAGMFDPTHRQDKYRKPYEDWLHAAEVRAVMRRTRLLTLPDDHELQDNWSPVAIEAGADAVTVNRARRRFGIASFLRFQRAQSGDPEHLSMHHRVGDAELFLLDSRTRRALRSADHLEASLLGDEAAWKELSAWLCDPGRRSRPKLVVTPSILLPRHRDTLPAQLADGSGDSGLHAALRGDAWDGYPQSFYRVLALIADERIPHVVFLSGDEHLGLLARVRLFSSRHGDADSGIRLHSIHTAGLNTPYRFANAAPADFVLREGFGFTNGGYHYRCEVEAETFAGAGFTHLEIAAGASGWQLRCEFETESHHASDRQRTLDL